MTPSMRRLYARTTRLAKDRPDRRPDRRSIRNIPTCMSLRRRIEFARMGMAERVMISAAAGMAQKASFLCHDLCRLYASRQAYDFIYMAIAEENLPVKIVRPARPDHRLWPPAIGPSRIWRSFAACPT
ncbi:MAG: hypothetical protein U1E55_14675 [Paracoccus sp. (in: a-proteobacteria)]